MNGLRFYSNINKGSEVSGHLIDLCCRCFNVNRSRSHYIMSKFFGHNNNFCAVGESGGRIVCFYGVIISEFSGEKFALSLNTMSDGSIKRATSWLGNTVYTHLAEIANVKSVIGYPNANIMAQRVKHMGWEHVTNLHYALLMHPSHYRDWMKSYPELDLLNIRIPTGDRIDKIFGLPLYSPASMDKRQFARPGLMSYDYRHKKNIRMVKVPYLEKKLCIKVLDTASILYEKLSNNEVMLSHDAIDVP